MIDILDLTQPEYQNLNAVQLSMVRAAQAKKDKILSDAKEEKRSLFYLLLSNGVARSAALEYEKLRIDEEAEADIETVREDLIRQIAYESLGSEGNEYGPYRYPENPNYSLTPSQRFLVVRNYYMEVTDDAQVRYEMYAGDTLARTYLGEFYQTLSDLLLSYIK